MFKTMHALRIVLAAGMLIAFQTGGAVAADCAAAAASVVRSTGGELLSAVPVQNDNCQVTVIIPAKDGNMPRKITQTVPAS